MIYHKLLKIIHLLKSRFNQTKTIFQLNQLGNQGSIIAKSYLKIRSKDFTNDEVRLFQLLRAFREKLYNDNRVINFEEIGSSSKMSVAQVSKRAASPEVWTHFFYQLTKNKSIQNVLEIGTNLGVSGQYFIKALEEKPKAYFTTLEGVKGLCEIASNRFETLTTEDRFRVIHGLYDQTLPDLIKESNPFDFVFIDGNHHYNATLNYFEMLKENLADQAIVIFDDINWSSGMRKAWQEIRIQKGVVFSINFFKLGIVVFDSKQTSPSKNHYQLFLSN